MQLPVVTSAKRASRPRFFFELAAAGFLTLMAIVLLGKYASAPLVETAKYVSKAAPLSIAPQIRDEQNVAEFMERFALSRVAAPLPERAVQEPTKINAPVLPSSAPMTKPFVLRDTQLTGEKSKSVAVKSPPVPIPRAVERVMERQPVPQAEAPKTSVETKPNPGKRIPIISDIAEKIPSGRDIIDGVGSLGRRVGSIFSRS